MKRSCEGSGKIYFVFFEWRYEWYYQNYKILEDSGVLIDGVTETVKHEIKKNKKADFLELC